MGGRNGRQTLRRSQNVCPRHRQIGVPGHIFWNIGRKPPFAGTLGTSFRYLGQEGQDVEGSSERLLTPGEVAALFRVDPKTVTRWAASGRISSIRTPGGHRRFRESEVRALLRGDPEPEPASDGHVPR